MKAEGRQLSARQGRLLVTASILGAFLLFAIVGPALLPTTFDNDSSVMLEAAENLVRVDTSYKVIADLIGMFGYMTLSYIIIFISSFIVAAVISIPKHIETFGVAVLSIVASAPLWMIRPQKEILVALLTSISLFVLILARSSAKRIVVVSLLYFSYAYAAGRIYFYLIPAAWVYLLTFTGMKNAGRFMLLGLTGIALLLAPSRVLLELNEVRDVLNALVVLNHSANTAFLNPDHGVGAGAFLVNYFYAAVRLNFPVIFNIRAQEIFLTLFSLSWFLLIMAGIRSGEPVARFVACLILAHLLVEWIFEPDLGSYLRHVSSIIVLIIPLLYTRDLELSGPSIGAAEIAQA
jgi:hypothetical protein